MRIYRAELGVSWSSVKFYIIIVYTRAFAPDEIAPERIEAGVSSDAIFSRVYCICGHRTPLILAALGGTSSIGTGAGHLLIESQELMDRGVLGRFRVTQLRSDVSGHVPVGSRRSVISRTRIARWLQARVTSYP